MMDKKTRDSILILEIFMQAIAFVLLFVNGVYKWSAYDYGTGYNRKDSMHSFSWLFGKQLSLGGELLAFILYLLIVATLVIAVICLLNESSKFNNIKFASIPAAAALLFAILSIWANNYNKLFSYNGVARGVSVSLGALFYVEIGIMVISTVLNAFRNKNYILTAQNVNSPFEK